MRVSNLSKRMMLMALAFVLIVGSSFSVISLAKDEEKSEENSAVKADEKNTEQPFAPSYITVKDHRKLTPEDWTDPEICAQCHPRQYEGWNGSMHSNAFKDPIFQAEWALAEKATGGALTNHCGGCHAPIGVATNTIKFDPSLGKHGGFTAPPIAAKGVSCDVCHTLSGSSVNTAVMEHGNSSFEMDPGKVKRATLKDADSPYHETEYSEHHTSSEFCGNCHNIFHPQNNFPVERTYDEWKYSVYAQNGVQCMDCHMVPVETAIRVADELKRPQDLDVTHIDGFAAVGGPYRKIVHDHGFVGGNAVVTAALNGEKSGTYDQAIQRLQTAASLNMFVKPGQNGLHKLVVRVNNDRAGHHIPTSLTHVRQIWLEVVVTDDQGRELLRSGTKDEKNSLPEDTVIFNAKAVDKEGKPTHDPWEIVSFTTVNTIPPKGHRDSTFAFNLPADSKKVNVTTRLHYRSFSQGFADKLLGKGEIDVPSVEMAHIEKQYPVVDHKITGSDVDKTKDAIANH